MSDDMRPEIGAYQTITRDLKRPDPINNPLTATATNRLRKGEVRMYTPNLDSLASRSMLFERAYVQQSVCSPSRTSMLTGRRPDTTRVHDLTLYWRDVAGNFTTLPQHLKDNGYKTAGVGKIFHHGKASGYDDPISWTEKYFKPNESYWDDRTSNTWMAVNEQEARQNPLPDMQITEAAVLQMVRFSANRDTPFFLGVGFMKPHLPFVVPERFIDLYPSKDVPLPRNPRAPVDMPEVAWSNFDELRAYADVLNKYGYGSINSTLPDEFVRQLRRAYYASVSYIDSEVGKLLGALKLLGLENDTIVSFVGDHGWHLGEHGEWCKHTNFELSTRAPMILSIPGLTDSIGSSSSSGRRGDGGLRTKALVEFVDLFPTLVDAVGLPTPALCPEDSRSILLCREGVSLMPLIKHRLPRWKRAAFSQYPRMRVSGDVMMGYSMRTETYRYTEWVTYDTFEYRPMWGEKRGFVELYVHKNDSDENVNVAGWPRFAEVVKRLSKELRKGWRSSSSSFLQSIDSYF